MIVRIIRLYGSSIGILSRGIFRDKVPQENRNFTIFKSRKNTMWVSRRAEKSTILRSHHPRVRLDSRRQLLPPLWKRGSALLDACVYARRNILYNRFLQENRNSIYAVILKQNLNKSTRMSVSIVSYRIVYDNSNDLINKSRVFTNSRNCSYAT